MDNIKDLQNIIKQINSYLIVISDAVRNNIGEMIYKNLEDCICLILEKFLMLKLNYKN